MSKPAIPNRYLRASEYSPSGLEVALPEDRPEPEHVGATFISVDDVKKLFRTEAAFTWFVDHHLLGEPTMQVKHWSARAPRRGYLRENVERAIAEVRAVAAALR